MIRRAPSPATTATPSPDPTGATRPRWWAWVALGLALIFTASVRLRLESMPLERDEGEYAYAGQLILQGVPPYEQAYNMKFPGTYVAYAAIMAVFGETTEGIHRGFIIINLTNVILAFLIARRIAGDTAAAMASAALAVATSGTSVLGLAGHATHLVTLPVLSALLLLGTRPPPSLFRIGAAGVCCGLGVLMKQPAVVFLLLGIALALRGDRTPLRRQWRRRAVSLVTFCVAAVVPHLATWAWLHHEGVFARFWFWTITYAREYGTLLSLPEGYAAFASVFPEILGQNAPLWVMAAAGLVVAVWHKPYRGHARFLGGWLLVSLLGVCPGLYFRSHYFIVLLPVQAVLAGVAVQAGTALISRRLGSLQAGGIAAVTMVAAVTWPLWQDRAVFFTDTPEQASRRIYGINPFVEAAVVAAHVRERCPPDATIAVIGSEPQIYFLARRRSATGYIYTYALMEPQPFAVDMQREMIREIETTRPEFLISVRTSTSWLMGPDSPREIFRWFEDYSRAHYSLVGLVDTRRNGAPLYLWDGDTWRHPDRQACDIRVWRRDPR